VAFRVLLRDAEVDVEQAERAVRCRFGSPAGQDLAQPLDVDELVVPRKPFYREARIGGPCPEPRVKGSRPNDRAPLLVLNQVGVPKRPEISVKDFGNAIELEPKVIIDFDAQLFGTAANNGQMIEEVSDKSKAAEAFRTLGNLLTNRSEQKNERQSVLAPILARLRLTKTRA
jgi:MinD-like ATPase involved in chromosome partitioning or flagellar assembly